MPIVEKKVSAHVCPECNPDIPEESLEMVDLAREYGLFFTNSQDEDVKCFKCGWMGQLEQSPLKEVAVRTSETTEEELAESRESLVHTFGEGAVGAMDQMTVRMSPSTCPHCGPNGDVRFNNESEETFRCLQCGWKGEEDECPRWVRPMD